MPKKRPLIRAALLPIAIALASCGGGGETTAGEAETATEGEPAATTPAPGSEPGGEKLQRAVKVEVAGFAYDPDPVRIETGGKVIWQNMDSAAHTATADDGGFDTGVIEEGKLKSETFKQAGTYAYHCELHPSMHGTVEVIEKQ